MIPLALLTACGQQHKAEGVIEHFLDGNLVNSNYKVDYGKLGSTRKLDDQILQKMRQASTNDPLFKQPVHYGTYKELDELLYLRTIIIQGKDTAVRTIYLHPELCDDGVMAVKEN
jgi:hypothetical protein